MFPENNGDATSTTSSPRGIDDCVAVRRVETQLDVIAVVVPYLSER